MIRAILIDDERKNLLNLKRLLEKYCSEISIIAEVENADDGIVQIRTSNPDLIFLDIQMPGKTGFDMLRELNRFDFEIVFVTAFSEYGVQAIKFSAIDYLLKPVNIDELKMAVSKAIDRISMKKLNERLENLMQTIQNTHDKSRHKIAISSMKETRFVCVIDIMRCESDNSYTHVILRSGERLVSTASIYEYTQMLKGYDFIRCHQSHLINSAYVKSLRKDNGHTLILTDGSSIPVSRQKKDEVKALLKQIHY